MAQDLATFPQEQEIITAKTPPDFGFHQILAPNLSDGSQHLVSSQLAVGGREGPPPPLSQGTAAQFTKLLELENLLASTDSLSPLTLEMVESALVGLKEKRAEHVRLAGKSQGRNMRDRDIRSFFPDLQHISVKGQAPLLMPHPGDNMTPMTDEAIEKQNKLRGLRHEMMAVSYTD